MSKAALSQVIIVLEDGVDIYFARQLVFQRLQTAKEQLPDWAEPEMGPISTGLGEIYQYTLESDAHTPMELRTIQDWYIAPQLRAIPGVNEVNSFGGFVKQYHVLVDQNRLLKYGITLTDVLEAIERNNANAGGNFLVRGWEQAYVRSLGLIQGIEDIENIVLQAQDGAPVFLRDVADVKLGPETRQGAVTRDGKGEAVAGMTIMLKDQNSKVVVEAVKKAIPKIQAGLPKGVKINTFYDRTALIQACIHTVGKALDGGRHLRHRGPVSLPGKLPGLADRGAVLAVDGVHCVHPDGLAGRHGQPDEPGRLGHRLGHDCGCVDRRLREHRAPSFREGGQRAVATGDHLRSGS